MSDIFLQCENCGTPFQRQKKEHKRNQKIGRKVFCSLSCRASKQNTEQFANGERESPIENIPREKRIRICDEFSQFRYFIRRIKSRIKDGLSNQTECLISYTDLKSLWESQLGVCPYGKFKMLLPKEHGNPLKKASLDRIDSSRGYEIGNIEFVCRGVNFAKNKYSKKEVLDFFSEIRHNQ